MKTLNENETKILVSKFKVDFENLKQTLIAASVADVATRKILMNSIESKLTNSINRNYYKKDIEFILNNLNIIKVGYNVVTGAYNVEYVMVNVLYNYNNTSTYSPLLKFLYEKNDIIKETRLAKLHEMFEQ